MQLSSKSWKESPQDECAVQLVVLESGDCRRQNLFASVLPSLLNWKGKPELKVYSEHKKDG